MGKVGKVAVTAVATIGIAVAGLALTAKVLGDRKLNRVVQLSVLPVPYTQDPTAITRGKYLFESRGCTECHGVDGRGKAVIDAPNGFYVKAPDITTGAGGVVAAYTEVDWVRTIRHGVRPDGRALFIMPSEDYNRLSDPDLAALVAYVRHLPPVAGEGAVIHLPLFLKGLYAFGAIQDSAEKIDHSKPPEAPVAPLASISNGAYVVTMCMGCHGPGLSGGKIPGTPPEWPPAANLTPGSGSVMPRYAALGDFKSMLRTGKRPDGTQVSSVMPFGSLKNLSDTDVDALHQYLATIPPKAAGNR